MSKGKPKYCSIGCRDGGLCGFNWKTSSLDEIKKHLTLFFEKNVIKNDGCWDWKGSLDKDGYAILNNKNLKYRRAHRASWFIRYGVLPKGIAAHTCDNKICTNPLHIFFTNQKGNSEDIVNKGKTLKGSKNGFSILNEEQVKKIKLMIEENINIEEIAKTFEVSKSCIYNIKYNRTWKHVTI